MKAAFTSSGPDRSVRVVLAFVALGLTSIFVIALLLEPDPRGFGTHQQLGLPPCHFRKFIGVSCPHCGMTTSFSNIVRGQIAAAWAANPLGIPLAVTWAACIPWCAAVTITGRWLLTDEPFQWLIFGTIGYLFLAFLLWLVRTLV